jgi:hypothetical protein
MNTKGLKRGLVLLAALAAASSAVGASNAGSSSPAASVACSKGLNTINGRLWVQYCGPSKATVRFSAKTVRFASGACITRNNVKLLRLGKRPLRGVAPGTKYWELTTAVGPDGVARKQVFIEWWLGKVHYMMVAPMKMTFRGNRTRGTFTGKLLSGTKPTVFRNRGTASGSFRC